MTTSELVRKIEQLPVVEQQEVTDFVEFLTARRLQQVNQDIEPENNGEEARKRSRRETDLGGFRGNCCGNSRGRMGVSAD